MLPALLTLAPSLFTPTPTPTPTPTRTRSLRMYNSLVERCFRDCVEGFRRKDLDATEEKVSGQLEQLGAGEGLSAPLGAAGGSGGAGARAATQAARSLPARAAASCCLSCSFSLPQCVQSCCTKFMKHSARVRCPCCPCLLLPLPATAALPCRLPVGDASRRPPLSLPAPADGHSLWGAVQRGGESDAADDAAGRRQVGRLAGGEPPRRRRPLAGGRTPAALPSPLSLPCLNLAFSNAICCQRVRQLQQQSSQAAAGATVCMQASRRRQQGREARQAGRYPWVCARIGAQIQPSPQARLG